MKKRHWTVTPWFMVFGVVMILMAVASYTYSHTLCYIELSIAVASIAFVLIMTLRFKSYIGSIVKSTTAKIKDADSEYLERYKYPVALAGQNGDIVWCNMRFRKMLGSGKNPLGDNINAYLSGYDINEISGGDGVDVACDGKEYTTYCMPVSNGVVCHFIENTYYKSMLREYNANLPCVTVITFDNADDFSNDNDEVLSQITIAVETSLQKWAAEYNALYKKTGSNKYLIVFRSADVEKMIAAKFPILKTVRSIEYNQHMATISVGLSRGTKSIKDSEANARKALEMALGRGGDQVAVIKDNSYEFFGGTAAASEKHSKVRMRVIANAVSRAVADCDKVYIMGHRFSDLDCVGAAIGMQCIMEKSFKRYCRVVVDRKTSMAKPLIDYTCSKLDSEIFVSPEEAVRGVTSKTLLIVVDTHIKTSLESAELYEKAKRVIVIDHHRKAVNYIDNALVFCHEPSASSTSEMCSEIISCMDDSPLGYVQADAMLSGIMLDTKNFVVKTGVRTFESAAYLRKKGANTLTVKEMFADSIDTYREKVEIVCGCQIYRGCAISYSSAGCKDVRMAAAQAADEMLTLQGVNASFVLFEENDKINISARSYGKINVQLVMEKLGGGGHQTMAAAQIENTSREHAFKQLVAALDSALDEQSE